MDEICLPYELLRLHGSPLEGFFFTFLFPWLFLFGIVGNCLNLMVLFNPGRGSIRRRSDSLLIALAFCDVLFLLLLLPSAMAQFDCFGQHPRFRLLYLSLRVHLVALANWCSAVAIWLIIAICGDRLLAIRSSLRLHPSDSSQCAVLRLVLSIVLLSGLLTSYNHFSYHCVLKFLCGHSQVVGKCFNVLQESWPGNHTNLTPHPLRAYVRWSMAANALLVIVLPVLLMLFLNASLLVAVRRNSFRLQCPKKGVEEKRSNGSTGGRKEFGRSVDQSRAEHRVTVGVAAIVSCFTLTQGPSALVLLANLVVSPPSRDPLWWDTVGSLTCFLVIVGKTLNCVLLCLASSAFRRRLVRTLLGRQKSLMAHGEGQRTTGLVTSTTRRSSSGASVGERRMKVITNANNGTTMNANNGTTTNASNGATTNANNGTTTNANNGTTTNANNGTATNANNGTATNANNGTATNANNGTTTNANNGTTTNANNGTTTNANNGTTTNANNGTATNANNGTTTNANNGTATSANNGTTTNANNGTTTNANNGTATNANNGTTTNANNGTTTNVNGVIINRRIGERREKPPPQRLTVRKFSLP